MQFSTLLSVLKTKNYTEGPYLSLKASGYIYISPISCHLSL